MWRTRKWAEGRSWLAIWRVASRVGWRESEEIVAVREASVGFGWGLAREDVERSWFDSWVKEGGELFVMVRRVLIQKGFLLITCCKRSEYMDRRIFECEYQSKRIENLYTGSVL